MSNLSDFIGGGKSRIVRGYQIHNGISSFTSPGKGKLIVFGIGGGASGAVGYSNVATPILATGGGAGELAIDVIDVLANDAFAISCGTGGAAASVSSVGAANGNDGANTTITGPNSYALTIKGGIKGLCTVGAQSQTGGAGGNGGTGGTTKVRRFAGGRGGNITGTATAATLIRLATGGGGVNTRGPNSQAITRAGDMVALTVTGAMGTGGGSAGARGGDITAASAGLYTGGGGYGGAGAANATTAGPNALGVATPSAPADILATLAVFGINHFGGGGTAAGPGGGQSSSTNPITGTAGVMGGTSGGANSASALVNGLAALMGAGSGGISGNSGSGTFASGKGGDGIVVTIYCEDV